MFYDVFVLIGWTIKGFSNFLLRAFNFKSYQSQINTNNNKNNSTIAITEGCFLGKWIREKRFFKAIGKYAGSQEEFPSF